jgi:RecJ-like exonuclease
MTIIISRVGEVNSAVFHFHAVSDLLDRQKVDEAETYLDGVRQRQGDRVHDAVLSMIAAARQVPPVY